MTEIRICSVHENLESCVFPKLLRAAPVGVENLWSGSLDAFTAEQPMHGRARRVHGIKDDKVACTVASTFEADNGEGMSGLLEIDGW